MRKKKETLPRALKLRQKMQRGMTKYRHKIGYGEFRPENFEIIPVDVILPGLDPLFHNYRIVNISDIHLGQWITPQHLDGIVEMVNNQKPDMVTITGDFVSYIIEDMEEHLEYSLKNLNPLDISIAVLGNHDHWLGSSKIRKVLEKSGIVDVSNDVYSIQKCNKNKRAELHIAGVDSVMLNKHRLDIVMGKLPPSGPAVLLAHEPDFADISSLTGRFGLQISGHSHGGQFVIPGIGTFIRGPHFTKYPLGEYRVGEMVQYTSRGVGTNVFWFRINCPPEITTFHLKSPEINNVDGA
ncbi:metallophosphoesterase [Methanobacterium alcaliphilum]|uniref:metallophosphoesterase n=1 Tax=Methanobacterium alcaliphilum TaxID=392018 RepID=UPI00200A4CD2|nr:metallophosphoesterase [Methanobacterium alcaliphilum]MCK9152321.1 metallophosphoesterase [Methanobacterium alcaliphilum]